MLDSLLKGVFMGIVDPVAHLANFLLLNLGLFLISLFPFLALVSQVSLAIRECALNSRKEDHPFSDTQYKSLEWIAYLMFILSWLCLVFGVIFVIGFLTSR